MSVKRQGDLRLLKDGVVFGPTDRPGLEKLLSAGRLTLADHVSVANAEWVPIAEYLAGGAARPPAATTAATLVPVAPRKQGDLRLLSGGRIIGSLTRGDVDLLWSGGRLDVEDLICAVGGPWMRVGDFVAPPKAAAPSPAATISPAVVAAPVATPMPAAPAIAYVVAPPPAPVAPVPPVVEAYIPPLIDPLVVPQPGTAAAGHYPLAHLRPPSPNVRDEWYVRVRGIHSAPLRKQHVKALFQAREVTLACVARHPTWHENDWRPLHSIAELADIARP